MICLDTDWFRAHVTKAPPEEVVNEKVLPFEEEKEKTFDFSFKLDNGYVGKVLDLKGT